MKITRRALSCIVSTLPIGCLLLAGCGGPMDGTPAENEVVESQAALSAPPPSCLTTVQCVNFPCANGNQYWPSPGPISFSWQTGASYGYGAPTCPGYYILDIPSPSSVKSGTAMLSVSPAKQPSPCPSSALNVYVYGHTAAGWTQVPGLTTLETPTSVQGQCALSDIETNISGLSQYDKVRVLTGGSVSTGAQLPITLEIKGCIPKTCATPGTVCGTQSDSCGGTIYCGPCAAPLPPPAPDPDPTPCRGRLCS